MIGINDLARDYLPHLSTSEFDSRYDRQSNRIRPFLDDLGNYSELVSVVKNFVRVSVAIRLGFARFNVASLGSTIAVKEYRDADPRKSDEIMNLLPPMLAGYEKRVRRLVEKARAFGSEPVLVTQPLVYGPVVDDVSGIELDRIPETLHSILTNSGVFWNVLEAYNDVVRKIGRANGVLVIDLAKRMPKSTRYFFDKMHLGNDGANKVSEIIAQSLCPFLASRFPKFSKKKTCPSI